MAIVRAAFRRLTLVPSWRLAPSVAFSNASKVPTIPTDSEQATGTEKKELDALMAGVEDPFNMEVNDGPHGTLENPRKVPSMFEERIVGCICEDDQTYVSWMVLKKGDSQRCECGHFFQLVQANPTKM